MSLKEDQGYAEYATELGQQFRQTLSQQEYDRMQDLADECLGTLGHICDSEASGMRVALAIMKMLAALQVAPLDKVCTAMDSGIVSYSLAAARLASGIELPEEKAAGSFDDNPPDIGMFL